MHSGSTVSSTTSPIERHSFSFSSVHAVPLTVPAQSRRSDWPLPRYDPTVTAAVIDRIQASTCESSSTGANETNSSVIMCNNNHNQGPSSLDGGAGRIFRSRFSDDFHDNSGMSGLHRGNWNGLTNQSPMPGQAQMSSGLTASRDADERLNDFNAMIERERQDSNHNGPPHPANRIPEWQRLGPAPPPNVNPFAGRSRPSVIQMSHSGFPPENLPFHQRRPSGDGPSDESWLRALNQQRSRMAAQDYIRDRARAPGAQAFPIIQTSSRGNAADFPPNSGSSDGQPGPFLPGGGFIPCRPVDVGPDRRPHPPQDPRLVTVLHTNPGQALPVQGPIRNSRVRQPPTRQPPLLPLPTPSPDNGMASSDPPIEGGVEWTRWAISQQPRSPAQFANFFSLVRSRGHEPGGPQTGSSRPNIIRSMASPYSRPFMVPSPEYMMRRNSGPPLPGSSERLIAPEPTAFGMPGYEDRRMREMQLRLDATRNAQQDTVNVNGEQLSVHQVFPTRVSRTMPHHDQLRALHDNNAEQRRRLIYMPQTQHPAGPYGIPSRLANSLMQFMDAGIFMSNEHGEPKLILEEDVISAIECDTTSFRFDNQFPATDECIICFEEFELQQEVRVLSCNQTHRFHKHCIDKWLIKNKPNCPICRQILPTLDPKKEVIAHVMPIIEPRAPTAGPSHAQPVPASSVLPSVVQFNAGWTPQISSQTLHNPSPR